MGGTAKHFHSDSDPAGEAGEQVLEDFELNPVRLQIVVSFPDINDPRPGNGVEHLFRIDNDPCRQVQDLVVLQFPHIAVGGSLVGNGERFPPGQGWQDGD